MQTRGIREGMTVTPAEADRNDPSLNQPAIARLPGSTRERSELADERLSQSRAEPVLGVNMPCDPISPCIAVAHSRIVVTTNRSRRWGRQLGGYKSARHSERHLGSATSGRICSGSPYRERLGDNYNRHKQETATYNFNRVADDFRFQSHGANYSKLRKPKSTRETFRRRNGGCWSVSGTIITATYGTLCDAQV